MWTVSYCSLRKMKDLFLSYNMASSNYSDFQQHHLVVVPFLEASYNHSSEGEDAQQSAAAIGWGYKSLSPVPASSPTSSYLLNLHTTSSPLLILPGLLISLYVVSWALVADRGRILPYVVL